jgi:hypothetical protein
VVQGLLDGELEGLMQNSERTCCEMPDELLQALQEPSANPMFRPID